MASDPEAEASKNMQTDGEALAGGKEPEELTLTYRDASFSVEDRVILKPVSGCLFHSEMVAVMGPSGCGKSTLLTMLAAKKTTEYEGTFEINGHKRNEDLLPLLSSYCPQQEILYPAMTVRESLKFYSLLQTDCTEEEAEARTNELIKQLELEVCADTMIGDSRRRGISGGQKRRVHIGKAITKKPRIVFLDEPTSGLSSTDSLMVGKILRNLADTEKTLIVCVIHQPDPILLLNLFDQLILLSSHGKCVYNGRMAKTVEYFEVNGSPLPAGENPADFFIDVITDGNDLDRSEEFEQLYKKNVQPEILQQMDELQAGKPMAELLGMSDEEGPIKRRNKCNRSWWFQFKTLFANNVMLRLRAWPDILRRAALYLIIGLLIGLIFFQAANTVPNPDGAALLPLYILISIWLTMLFAGIFSLEALPKTIEDRTIYKYDAVDGIYAATPYFCAQSLTMFLESVVDVVLCGLPAYWLVGYNYDQVGAFFFYLAGLIMTYLASESVLLILAYVCKDAEMANGLTVAVMGVLFIFSGLLVNPAQSEPWLSWAVWISPYWYAFEALTVNWARYYDFSQLGADDSGADSSADNLYDAFGMNPDRMGWDILIVAAFCIVYRLIAVCALKYMHNPKV